MLAILAALSLSLTEQEEKPKDSTQCEFDAAWEAPEGRKPTVMYVGQNQADFDDEDAVFVAFSNDDWSIVEDEKLGVIKVTGNDGSWFSNEATGMEHGFSMWVTYKNMQNVFQTSAMSITRQDKKIDNLRLDGMRSDWLSFTICRGRKVAAKAERQRLENLKKAIPKDPFAK